MWGCICTPMGCICIPPERVSIATIPYMDLLLWKHTEYAIQDTPQDARHLLMNNPMRFWATPYPVVTCIYSHLATIHSCNTFA